MLWVGSKQRSRQTLTAQHQALLGCLPHRLFVGLAQVNQLLDALLGLQEKEQGNEFWLSGLEQEHSHMGKVAEGAAVPWCRNAPHPLFLLTVFPLPLEHAALLSPPHISPSSSPAPHTLPHVSAPPHPPTAPGNTRGPGGDGESMPPSVAAQGQHPRAVAPAHVTSGSPSTYPLAEAGVFCQAAELG